MLCQKLIHNKPFRVQHKEGFCFNLNNIALDLSSTEAALYLVINDKQILIAQLSRKDGGVKSINLALEFSTPQDVVLLSIGGSVHIIGAYKANFGGNSKLLNLKSARNEKKANAQEMIDQKESQSKQQKQSKSKTKSEEKLRQNKIVEENISQPLRRSTRARAVSKPIEPANAKAMKRQKQQLKSMASYFNCKQNELDDDEQDDSFDKQEENQQQDDQDDDEEGEGEENNDQEEDKQLLQVQSKGISARKKKAENTKQKPRPFEGTETNTSRAVMPHLQNNVQKSQKEKQPEQHFSVPTRNPYI